jgi:hypothetical protein
MTGPTLTPLWFFLTTAQFDLSPFYCSQEGIHTVTEESAILREKVLSIKLDRYNQTCLFAKANG